MRHAEDAGDGRDVAEKHEAELIVERRVDRIPRNDEEERIAVRERAHDRLGGDISAGPRTVLDHERLTETLRQPLSQQASGSVRPAAGGLPDNDAHRPRWIGLRPSNMRDGRQRGSARG